MKHIIRTITVATLVLAGCGKQASDAEYVNYVDTSIGTGGHGHVFVGANVPFGFVQLGPTSIPQAWDWTSGYHVSDSTVIGFSHTHLSGTGIGDLFDITVMPAIGSRFTYARGTENDPQSGLWSYADRTREISRPGYYSVPLTRYGIKAELTATERTGLHRYTFPASDSACIVLDLENGGCWDRTSDTHVEVYGNNAIKGWRHSRGWANNQKLYFYAEFSKPFTHYEVIEKEYSQGNPLPLYAKVDFTTTSNEQILLKVALSPVSMEGAQANMKAELPGWDFMATAKKAEQKWEQELSKIKITTQDTLARKVFYTALYHTMVAPSVFCDVNGDYRGADDQIHKNAGFTNYTTFSLWDTYRAALPLATIIHPEKEDDIINTMLHIYKEQGKLPVWHLMGCETNCMVGNPGIPPVADAITKGFEGFDKGLAMEAMITSALRPDRGQELRLKYGYIPCDSMNESVAYELEYALADGALAIAAKQLAEESQSAGNDEKVTEYLNIYDRFYERSRSYKHLFDAQTGFMRGKDSNGTFRTPFNPFSSAHRADDYCEGNAWQYTWLVPHDFKGLTSCFGGKEQLLDKLDSLFTVSSVIEGTESSPDISGLIGQYAHGNEPSHHILYFYTIAGQPWKTADKVRQVLNTLYHPHPDGLSGNEDVGQMSAWYILSSLGFYQVEPAGGRYIFGSPLFDKAEIKVSGGTFTITAENNSPTNRYIQSITLNGKPYTKEYIDYKDIAAGGELVFRMGAEPNIWYRPQ